MPYGELEDFLPDIDEVSKEELEAFQELKEFSQEILKRQAKFQLKDVAEVLVDNKMLISEVDCILGTKSLKDLPSYNKIPSNQHMPVDASTSSLGMRMLFQGSNESILLNQDNSLDDNEINRLYEQMIQSKPNRP